MAALHRNTTAAAAAASRIRMRGGQIATTCRDPGCVVHGCGHLSVSNDFLKEIGKRLSCFLWVNLPRAAKWVQ